ncbi:cytochrome d ubiquinol oxidase subunit II [Nannocystis sp.]|uniref:cytochrome d ubiquinol oxidase subunit II n=1 Tax=Nannocystis sp. TaxID=1962667 RepID=UPI0025F27AAA|nr:cytochrome d ubiquinol oxidase subunit II [Nannocystis sp.]MBK7824669.1 cytochrome d ubiquinol oxidase subunit II [Nannocystis sp.]
MTDLLAARADGDVAGLPHHLRDGRDGTPITLGALSTGIALDPSTGRVRTDFISEWLAAPFPFAAGLFTLCLFAFLAAVYLADAARADPDLSDMFHRRALVSAGLVAATALLTFIVAWRPASARARGR